MRIARREPSNDAIVLGVLDAVEGTPSVTQRSVARELGIALGLVNAYLHRCLSKGLIKIGQVPPRRCAYYLTPRGTTEKSRLTATYLMDSFAFFREARMQCNELFQALAARDNLIEIAGIAPTSADAAGLSADLEGFGPIDAIVVTALEQSREAFASAVELWGPERVYAPALARVYAPALLRMPPLPPLPPLPAARG